MRPCAFNAFWSADDDDFGQCRLLLFGQLGAVGVIAPTAQDGPGCETRDSLRRWFDRKSGEVDRNLRFTRRQQTCGNRGAGLFKILFTRLADTHKKKALCAACVRDMMLRHRARFPFKAARRSGSTDERGVAGDGCCSERILRHKNHNTVRTFWTGRGETNFDHIGS